MISIFDKRIYLKFYKLPYFGENGFTLIELMVTVGIFVFMTALVMSKYNDFYSGIIFKNMAYDIAITVRQAQSYGISVKADTVSSSFNKAYGVNFSSANPSRFSLYPYSSSGSVYTFSGDPEKTYNLKFGATVYDRRVGSSGGGSTMTPVNVLDIIFQRPNPEVIICGTTSGGGNSCIYTSAQIQLRLGTKTKQIDINKAGQVSIAN